MNKKAPGYKPAANKSGSLFFIAVLSLFIIFSCSSFGEDIDYRSEMRAFVVSISEYSKSFDKDFIIIPQNGIELATDTGAPGGNPESAYLSAIDGNGQEDLFFGYNYDDKPTPPDEIRFLVGLLNISKNAGNRILVTDYCFSEANIDASYSSNNSYGFISFAADKRELNSIPSYPPYVYAENSRDVTALNDAANFLYLINPEGFTSRADFVSSVVSTNYDLLIMDMFFNDGSSFSAAEIEQLKEKADGGRRLVVCYMSIGEAEDYRYYWDDSWTHNPPDWIDRENPDWEGNYKVRYWNEDWQNIITGNDDSYIKMIIDSGFDGVYLDIIDAFEYFE